MSKYAESGVNLEQSDAVKEEITSLVRSTFGPNVLSAGGEFGGVYSIPDSDLALVSSVDGVGTKLKVAVLAGIHNTVGQDLVNHCVNDIGVMGAKPAFFLDYLATGKLDQTIVLDIISGLVQACKENGIALIGGETAQMPGMYAEGEYDLAGAIVGFINQDHILPRTDISPGDVIIGLKSNGLHTNGYSLARDIVFGQNKWDVDTLNEELGHTWGEELLRVHLSYAANIQAVITSQAPKAFAHITGGGIEGNLIRVLPETIEAVIQTNEIPVDPVFSILRDAGKVSIPEMYQVFNMGVGLIIIASVDDTDTILSMYPEEAFVFGECLKCETGSKVTLVT